MSIILSIITSRITNFTSIVSISLGIHRNTMLDESTSSFPRIHVSIVTSSASSTTIGVSSMIVVADVSLVILI
jgi:hypothetical protein